MACTSGGIQVQPLCSPCTGTHTDPPGSGSCETNCTSGTIPNHFLLTMPTSAFNPFIGCGELCAGFAGSFILNWYGSVGGICRWTYCLEDPCNPGAKAMYVLSYRIPNLAVLILVYGLTDCSDTAWLNWNEWRATIGGPGNIDCLATIDHDLDYFLDAATPNCGVFGAFPPHIKALD